MIRDGLGYPLRGPNAEVMLLRGYVVALATVFLLRFPFPISVGAILPLVLLLGYLTDVFEDSINGGRQPPRNGPVGRLLKRGAISGGLTVLSLIVPVAILLFVVINVQQSAGSGLDVTASLAVQVGMMVVLLLAAAGLYLVPVLLAMAFESSLRSALDLYRLYVEAVDGPYLLAWLIGGVLLTLAVMVAQLLALLGPIGQVVGIAVVYYVLLVGAYMSGRAKGSDHSVHRLFR